MGKNIRDWVYLIQKKQVRKIIPNRIRKKKIPLTKLFFVVKRFVFQEQSFLFFSSSLVYFKSRQNPWTFFLEQLVKNNSTKLNPPNKKYSFIYPSKSTDRNLGMIFWQR